MEWVNRVSGRTAMLFAVCWLLCVVGVAHAGDKPQLNGSWNFNPEQSDNAQQKIQQAQQTQQTVQRGAPPQGGYPGGGGYPGTGYPGGGGGLPGNGVPAGGGYPGGGNYPVPSGGSRTGIGSGSEISSQEWAQLAANPKFLNITQHDDQIVITDSDHTRILYPDGKKHQTKDESGQKVSTKTEWQGGELVSETRTWSGKFTERFRLSSDGKELTVISRFESSSLPAPLSIQRAYDLADRAH